MITTAIVVMNSSKKFTAHKKALPRISEEGFLLSFICANRFCIIDSLPLLNENYWWFNTKNH
jgi:hypothetical protein